jgi:hypothetical protein
VYDGYAPSEIISMDETSIYYDTPPFRIWSRKGGSCKIDRTQKHSDRITVVVTIRADGTKLPLFFIVNENPGGRIEMRELASYPKGHYYAVHENAWMDARVWQIYVRGCLAPAIESPSVLLVDNFDAHVSDAGQSALSTRPAARFFLSQSIRPPW